MKKLNTEKLPSERKRNGNIKELIKELQNAVSNENWSMVEIYADKIADAYFEEIPDNPLDWISDEEINSWIDKVNEVEFDERPVTTKEIAVWYAKRMRQRMAEEFERRMK